MRIRLGNSSNANQAPIDRRLVLTAMMCGLLAAGANLYFLSKVSGKSRIILKARKDIEAGTSVTRDDFNEFEIRSNELDFKGIFVESADFAAFDKRSIAVPMRKDDPLLLQSFDRVGQIEVPPGKRLITFAVENEEQAIGYLIRAGNRVDLYGWINGVQRKIATNLCVSATGKRPYDPRNEGDQEIEFSSISVLIDENDVTRFNDNLHTAQNLRLTSAGNCEPGISPVIEPTITPTGAALLSDQSTK
jgi:hypothetical protein